MTGNQNQSLVEEELISEINMTPLVDVSLVLVIIFMVVAPFFSNVLKPLLLPFASNAALTQTNTINVSIFPDGTLAVGPDLVAEAQLSEAIHKEISSGHKPWALVRAGASVPHGRVMDVIEIIKAAGIDRLGFATQHTDIEAQKAQ